MKLSFKTISNKQFSLDVDPQKTVKEVKEEIFSTEGAAYPVSQTILIFQGKILKDDTTLQANSVTENTFIVVMVQKGKSPAPPAAPSKPTQKPTTPSTEQTVGVSPGSSGPVTEQPAPQQTTNPSSTTAPSVPESNPPTTNTQPTPAVGTPAVTATGQPGGGAYDTSASTLATGSQLEQSVNSIVEMGFPKDQVMVAMRAAYNNPERAVEYLMTGIPEGAGPPPPQAAPRPAPQNPPTQQNPSTQAPPPSQPTGPNAQPLDMFAPPGQRQAQEGSTPLSFLRNNPQFQHIRRVIQTRPELLQPTIQEMAKNNPQLINLINQNQEEFMSLLNDGGDFDEMEDQRVEHQIQLTEAEGEAITRLVGLGFRREAVLEAYLACDRNEELAANYLLENGADDMQM